MLAGLPQREPDELMTTQAYEIQTTTDALFALTELSEEDDSYHDVEDNTALSAIADEISWQGYERPKGVLLRAEMTTPENGMEVNMYENPEGELIGVTSMYLVFSGGDDFADIPNPIFESMQVALKISKYYQVDTALYPDITVTTDEMMETVKNNESQELVCPSCGDGFVEDDYSTVEDDDGILYCSIPCLNEELT